MGDVFSMPIKSFKDNNNRNKHFLMRIAAWLIDNTALTFNQIAQCCGLALKEVQTIADEEIEVEEYNPIISGIITEKEIDDSEKNPNHIPKLIVKNIKKSHRITGNNIATCPTAKRRDKPDAVHFLTINFPELSNSMIAKLISTTNCTVEQIRDGSHHNMKNIIPRDPVLIGLCRQEDLNAEVEKVKVEKEKQERLKNIKNSY